MIEDPDRLFYTHDRGSMNNNILSNTNSYTIGIGCLIKDIIPEEENLFISLLKQSPDKNFIRDTQK